MTYDLLIGDRSYSSWSLRGWLLFSKFGIPVNLQDTRLYEPQFLEDLKRFAPARSVPVMRLPEGQIVMDTAAIAETLAERHPDAGFWPEDGNARAFARSITAEMHSGFMALRGTFPMNLRHRFVDVPVPEDVSKDLARIELIWSEARKLSDGSGPWLFGRYSVADAFFAPVATRMITYGLPASPEAEAYLQATISDPVFNDWRDRGLKDAPQSEYDMPWAQIPWPDVA